MIRSPAGTAAEDMMATKTRKPAKRPALSAADRDRRDRLILDLYVAGYTQPTIAAHPRVKLTTTRVNQIVAAELKRAREDHILGNENAMTIHRARMERLVQAAFSHVDAGELRAIEVTRRLMADQAKLNQLAEGPELGSDPVPPMGDAELDDGEPLDELAKYRAQRTGAQ